MRPCVGKAENVEGTKKWLREGKQMERLNFRGGGVRRESFLCMSGENGSLLYTAQREFGAGCGLVSSTQRGAFLSGLPRGGAPAAASNTGQEASLTGGARGAGMERCLVVPGNGHVLDLWNRQVEQSDDPDRKYLSLCVPPWTREEEDTASNLTMKSRACAGEQKLWLERVGQCWQLPKQTTQSL